MEFCGYSVPHPLEDKILFRVQTHRQKDALQVILKGLDELEKVRKLTDLERSAGTFLPQRKMRESVWEESIHFKSLGEIYPFMERVLADIDSSCRELLQVFAVIQDKFEEKKAAHGESSA